jgi:outer membrane lipoprotein-sorting protein
MLSPLVLLVLLPGAEPNEAEQLFRQMEAKVIKAKTVECAFDAKVEADKTGTIKGTLLLGEGKKCRMEMGIEFGGMKEKFTMISDGTKMKAVIDGKPTPAEDANLGYVKEMRAAVVHGVAFTSWSTGLPVPVYFRASDFKLGKKEMVDKQEAQVVQYTLTHPLLRPKQEAKYDVTVWIDTKTQLPLKRVFNGTMTETYTKLEVDGKIDAKQFELPKE